MPEAAKTVLVVGGDGFLGNAAASFLSARGGRVIKTTRRMKNAGGDTRFLELSRQDDFAIPSEVDAAIIVAANANFAACETSRDSAEINVEKTVALASRLLAAGIFTVYLSSSAVFADAAVCPDEETPGNPATAYGRQKAECERMLREQAERMRTESRLCVVRLTKVVAWSRAPLAAWLESWNEGRAAHPFSDLRLSPLSASYVASCLQKAIDGAVSGCLHISGDEGVSYADFCCRLASAMGVPERLVAPVNSHDAGARVLFRPVDGRLGMRRTMRVAGITPQPLAEVVEHLAKTDGK